MALPDWDGKTTLRQLTAEVERQREIIDRLTDEKEMVTEDLQRIAHELGIGAKPYSGHEAMEKDILPEIRRLRQLDRERRAPRFDCLCRDGVSDECPIHDLPTGLSGGAS